jgi:hypothetical protein
MGGTPLTFTAILERLEKLRKLARMRDAIGDVAL